MDCRKCADDLTAYIDGELADAEHEQLRRHLEKCPPCLDEFRELSNTRTFVVSHAKELEPVPEIWNNLRSRITEMPAPSDASTPFRFLVLNRWAAAAAMLAATLLLALGLWGYLQYQQSRAELESYMNEYIQMRTLSERLHTLRVIEAQKNRPANGSIEPGSIQNPFVDIRPTSITNPFRAEER